MLSAMRYKSFIWPHNPRIFRMQWQRRVTVLDAPAGQYVLQELGKTCRILRGEGEFFGKSAYSDFRRLADVFRLDGPGVLVHPLWESQPVYFTSLELTQEPRQSHVAYAFTFTEERGNENVPDARASMSIYTVAPGDTAWSIAQRFSVSLQTLLQNNPGIANPNLLTPGQEVRLL